MALRRNVSDDMLHPNISRGQRGEQRGFAYARAHNILTCFSFNYFLIIPGMLGQPEKSLNFFYAGGLRPPAPCLKVGRLRGLRNDGPVHGPWPGPMALAHWARVRPWSMGPGLGPGPALVHGPGPGPWPWPIGPGSGPGPWARALRWLAGRPKKKFKLFSGAQQKIPEEFPNGLRVRYPLAH